MRTIAENVAVSAEEESKLKLLGDIFRKAILPKGKRGEIFDAIKDLAKNFPNASSDTKSVQHWLESLAEDVGE